MTVFYASSDDEKIAGTEQFFEKLDEILPIIGNNREIVVLGDFNCRTESQRGNKIVRPYSEPTLNEN